MKRIAPLEEFKNFEVFEDFIFSYRIALRAYHLLVLKSIKVLKDWNIDESFLVEGILDFKNYEFDCHAPIAEFCSNAVSVNIKLELELN